MKGRSEYVGLLDKAEGLGKRRADTRGLGETNGLHRQGLSVKENEKDFK